MTVTRGTSNTNQRGSAEDRRRRRVWLIQTWPADIPGFARCFRCGRLVYNPDDAEEPAIWATRLALEGTGSEPRPLSVDRIVPGCQGGTYRRGNIRPCCELCNSTLGGATRGLA